MKGDIVIVEEHHRRAADEIANRLAPAITRSGRPYVLSVAGESGSGKSETARALADAFERLSFRTYVFQQDDYFVLPPGSNDKRRREDIGWVGPGEVNLSLLDSHLAKVKTGSTPLTKPLVDYAADEVNSEEIDPAGLAVAIAEGTYTSLLDQVDTRIFITRNWLETLESRVRRGREAVEPFIERVLEIEHGIIAPHRELADVIIDSDYGVSFPSP